MIAGAKVVRALVAMAMASAWIGGCTNTVSVFGDDGDEGCGERPPSEGWCPPAWACIDGEWMDTAGACPDPCPIERPGEGARCDAQGALCSYEAFEEWGCDEGEWVTVKVQCTESGWTTVSNYCLPEPTCPDDPPIAGTDCSGWEYAYYCGYQLETSCGTTWMDAYCDYGAPTPTWEATLIDPCDDCRSLDAASCAASEACRWLEPGCGEGALPEAGCFHAKPCAPEDCGDGESCEVVGVDPCHDASCDACWAETSVCLP